MNFFEIKDGALDFVFALHKIEVFLIRTGLLISQQKKKAILKFLMITLLSKTATSTLLLQTLDVSVSIMKRMNFY